MNYIWKFVPSFKDFYGEINSATLTGAIDVIVVQQSDGSYSCSPFHVRFGKIGVLRSREKVVDIKINGQPVDIHMKLGETGEAFFVEETDDPLNVPSHLATSPIPLVTDIKKELELLKKEYPLDDVPSNEVEVITPDYSAHPPRNIEASFVLPSENLSISPGSVNTSESRFHADCKPSFTNITTSTESSAIEDDTSLQDTDLLPQNTIDGGELQDGFMTAKTVRIEPSDSRNILNESSSFVPIKTDECQTDIYLAKNSLTESTGNELADRSDDDKNKIKTKRKRKSKKRSIKSKENVSDPSGTTSADVTSSSEDANIELVPNKLNINVAAVPLTTITAASPQIRSSDINDSEDWHFDDLSISSGFHPYSEGEISPPASPSGSRPSTPKSDTEYEIKRMEAASQTESDKHHWSWTWGELPVPPKVPSEVGREDISSDDDSSAKAKQIKKDHEQQRSRFGGVFHFIGMSKTGRQSQECEGLYLEDLNVKDPEMAARYFSRNSTWTSLSHIKDGNVKDEDAESGNGPSLPQSPHSVEGAIGGPVSSADSDSDEKTATSSLKDDFDIAFSLCGNLSQHDYEVPEERFNKFQVTYEAFCSNPNLVSNPDLVVRFNGKFYNWQTAAPMLISCIVFQRPLPDNIINNLIKNHMPKKPKKSEGKSYSWFNWRRSTVPDVENKKNEKKMIEENKSKSTAVPNSETHVTESLPVSIPSSQSEEGSSSNFELPSHTQYVKADRDDEERAEGQFADSDNIGKDFQTATRDDDVNSNVHSEKYKKSLRLNSEQIKKLDLQPGPNEVVFSVTTAYQGTTRCKCHIYLWKYDDHVVISDIDGTITKSDVLGHILPIIGKSWAQAGVAHLFTKIKNNGYQFLYLSARAIGQAHTTREYLRSVRQGDVTLPDGPLLLNPSSLMSALHREVIEKKPEEFKISCLRDILALFPSKKPFYAGYGNRINDVWAYRAVGIPMNRIFTINHKGELKHEQLINYQSSYINMSNVVDHFFPPLRRCMSSSGTLTTDFYGADEYSSYTYWRTPLPDLVIDVSELKKIEKSNSKLEIAK